MRNSRKVEGMKRLKKLCRAGIGRRSGRWSALVGTTILVAAATSGVAGAATAGALATPCGYSESGGYAWYNHCTSDGSHIVIRLDVVLGLDGNRCVGPGVTLIGFAADYRNAYYTGQLC